MVYCGNIRARVAGTTFASLLADMNSAEGDLEGFLLGSVTQQQVRHIEDDISTSDVSVELIAIRGFLSVGPSMSFYNSAGRVDQTKLFRSVTTSPGKNIIGWFKFRRGTSLRPSLRELSVHRGLQETIWKQSNQKTPIVFGLFNHSILASSAHSFDYKVFICENPAVPKSIETIELEIANLGKSCKDEYKGFNAISDLTNTEHDMLSSVRTSCSKTETQVHKLEHYLEQSLAKLLNLAEEVHESSCEIQKLRTEIQRLKYNGN